MNREWRMRVALRMIKYIISEQAMFRFAFIVVYLIITSNQTLADGVMCSEDSRVATVNFGSIDDLVFDGALVYTCDFYTGLVIYDISDPANEETLSTTLFFGATKMQLSGSTLFVLGSPNSGGYPVKVFDVSDPHSPVLLTEMYTPKGEVASSFVVDGQRLYLAYQYELYEYDISNPSSPALLSQFSSPLYLWHDELQIIDSDLYVYTGSRVDTINLDEARTGNAVVRSVSGSHAAESYEIRDGYIFLTSRYYGLTILDIRSDGVPIEVFTEGSGRSYGTALVGSTLYVATHYAGIKVYDIQDPRNPRLVEQIDPGLPMAEVIVNGEYLYGFEWTNSYSPRYYGLLYGFAFDLNRLRASSELGAVDIGDGGGQVAISDGISYVTNGNSIHLADVSDPNIPIELGTIIVEELPQELTALVVRNGVLYAAGADGIVRFFDVNDPMNPELIAIYNADDTIQAFELNQTTMYLGGTHSGMQIVDVASPSSPTLVTTYSSGLPLADVRAIDVNGSIASVAIEDIGIELLDLSNITNPVLLSRTTLRQDVLSVTLCDGNAYYCKRSTAGSTTERNVIYRFDISDPTLPALLSTYLLYPREGNFASEFLTNGRYGYLRDGNSSIIAFDLENQNELTRVGTLRKGGASNMNFVIEDDVLFMASDRLYMLDVRDNSACRDCFADFNGDALLDRTDIDEFLSAFYSHELYADLDHNGYWNYFDVVEYIIEFRDRCP